MYELHYYYSSAVVFISSNIINFCYSVKYRMILLLNRIDERVSSERNEDPVWDIMKRGVLLALANLIISYASFL